MNTFTKIKYDQQILDKVHEEIRQFLLENSQFFDPTPSENFINSGIIFKNDHLMYQISSDSKITPMDFDLNEMFNYHQNQKYRLKNEPLARACLLDKGEQVVFDITGGTGKDLTLLKYFGAKITCFERHPLIYLMLLDAIKRSKMEINLYFLNSIDLKRFCEENGVFPDVIYYDPMYPDKKKSALPRKEMQIFKTLDLKDSDELEVLKAVLKVAKKRVVVKRPIKASSLLSPTYSLKGSTTRYDVYQVA